MLHIATDMNVTENPPALQRPPPRDSKVRQKLQNPLKGQFLCDLSFCLCIFHSFNVNHIRWKYKLGTFYSTVT